MNVIALLFFLAAVLVFLLGLFKVAIPDPVLLGPAELLSTGPDNRKK
jgi:hypothetical protein